MEITKKSDKFFFSQYKQRFNNGALKFWQYISDILKNTPKTNPDNAALDQAQEVLKEIMTHINEDKRKTEGQVTLFNIFNEIDNCPVSKEQLICLLISHSTKMIFYKVNPVRA